MSRHPVVCEQGLSMSACRRSSVLHENVRLSMTSHSDVDDFKFSPPVEMTQVPEALLN